MAKTPWMTSNSLIKSVKRRISFPTDQSTFTDEDILTFTSEEMAISQVPSMMEYHEEYLVYTEFVPLKINTSRYPIPKRAVGMKLRDVFYGDVNGNMFEMTRINADDKSHFNLTSVNNSSVYMYYLENNEIVLVPQVQSLPTGYIVFTYFQRPNQLVLDDEVATISSFQTDTIIDNTTLTAGDTYSYGPYTFTAISSGVPLAYQFLIGANSIATTTNLVTAINSQSTGVVASNVSGSVNTLTLTMSSINSAVQIKYPYAFNLPTSVYSTSNTSAFTLPTTLRLVFTGVAPSTFTVGTLLDLIETDGGHRNKGIDIPIIAFGGSSVEISLDRVPLSLTIGDYAALAGECYIPQIPTDLHNTLAERACERILQALGDQAGLAVTKAKIGEMEHNQGILIDNRVDGSPQKVLPRHSLLRYNKFNYRRR